MNEQVFALAGLAVLFVLCLPLAIVRKLVLEVCAWALRLGLIALIAGAAYLWFNPTQLPAEVTDALSDVPRLRAILPEPGTPMFGVCAAGLAVAVFLPVLAVLDVTRKLAGRLRRLTAVTEGPVAGPPAAAPVAEPAATPVPQRIDRWSAADAMTAAGGRSNKRVRR